MKPYDHKELTITFALLMGGVECSVPGSRWYWVGDKNMTFEDVPYYSFVPGMTFAGGGNVHLSRYMAAKEYLESLGYAVRNGKLKKLP